MQNTWVSYYHAQLSSVDVPTLLVGSMVVVTAVEVIVAVAVEVTIPDFVGGWVAATMQRSTESRMDGVAFTISA